MKRKPLRLHVNRKIEASPVPLLDRPIVHPIVEVADAPFGLLELTRHAHELPIPKLVGES